MAAKKNRPGDPELWIEWTPLQVAKRWPKNPKTHDLPAIKASLRRHGFVELAAVDERTGRFVAGNGRLEALLEMHEDGEPAPARVRVLPDGQWAMPVLRGARWKSEAEAEAYLVGSNQIGISGGTDGDALRAMLGRIKAHDEALLETTGFGAGELRKLLAQVREVEPDADVPEVPPSAPVAKLGDVWKLGRHRLICADSLDPEVRRKALPELVDAVVTDPPYAIYGSSTGVSAAVSDGKMVLPFFTGVMLASCEHVRKFGHVYVFCDWRSYPLLWEASKQASGGKSAATALEPKNLIVWDKGGGGLGSAYANTYELVGFFTKIPALKSLNSTREAGARVVRRPNLIRCSRTGTDREHNAAKPVTLLEELVSNSTDEGGTVVDFFAGSGSIAIAAERLGRAATMFEIDPGWCDVIVERWQRVSGKKAARSRL